MVKSKAILEGFFLIFPKIFFIFFDSLLDVSYFPLLFAMCDLSIMFMSSFWRLKL